MNPPRLKPFDRVRGELTDPLGVARRRWPARDSACVMYLRLRRCLRRKRDDSVPHSTWAIIECDLTERGALIGTVAMSGVWPVHRLDQLGVDVIYALQCFDYPNSRDECVHCLPLRFVKEHYLQHGRGVAPLYTVHPNPLPFGPAMCKTCGESL